MFPCTFGLYHVKTPDARIAIHAIVGNRIAPAADSRRVAVHDIFHRLSTGDVDTIIAGTGNYIADREDVPIGLDAVPDAVKDLISMGAGWANLCQGTCIVVTDIHAIIETIGDYTVMQRTNCKRTTYRPSRFR